jgi:hypothetical protein
VRGCGNWPRKKRGGKEESVGLGREKKNPQLYMGMNERRGLLRLEGFFCIKEMDI